MVVDPFADPEVHRSRGTVRGLVMCHFRRPERDWIASRLDVVSWRQGWRVLDAGCGPGAYVPAVRGRVGAAGTVVALDISHDRLLDVPGAARVHGDVTRLPLDNAAFDAVLAMHMLYHVADIPAALRELRRVLRDDGALIVSTNAPGDRDEPQVCELYLRCGGSTADAFGDRRFDAVTGRRFLERAFSHVEVHPERSQLLVPDAAAVVNSFASMRYTLERDLEPGLAWDDFMARIAREAATTIEREGAFVVDCESVVFVCRG